MKFYSRTEYPKTIPTPSGEKIEDEFGLRFDKELERNIVAVVGKRNVYERTQAGKEGALLSTLIQRYASGDMSALEQRQGTFADLTQFPTTLAEAQQQMIDAERIFYDLPVEVRREFDHVPSLFLQ